MNVAGQDGDLYPALPMLSESSEFSLPQDSLRGMIEKTQFAIAVDDAREVLTGALLEISGGDATMVALDGFRMAYKREKVSDVMDVIRAIIPGRAVGDLAKLLPGGEEAFATLAFGGNDRMQVSMEKTDVYVTLIGGEYINYRRLLPTSFKMRAVAALEPLRQCIDRAALLARDGSSNLIRFRLHDSMMEIESSSQLGDAHEEMPLEELQGGELTIAFNVRYMQDVVRTIDAEKIILNFNDSLSPCVITPADDLDYVHLVCRCARGTRRDGRAGHHRRHLHRAGGGRHRHRAPERAVRGKDTAPRPFAPPTPKRTCPGGGSPTARRWARAARRWTRPWPCFCARRAPTRARTWPRSTVTAARPALRRCCAACFPWARGRRDRASSPAGPMKTGASI